MKITQEVREFARLQDAGLLNSTPRPFRGGDDSPQASEGRGSPPTPFVPSEVEGRSPEGDAEAGMAEMSQRYREGGNELYIGANGRERD
jgi:phosphomethylpyrimidine synthase